MSLWKLLYKIDNLLSRKPENNPTEKGFNNKYRKSVKYYEYLSSPEWKSKRAKILKMAGYKCRKCGKPATEVHHETYERIFNERLTDLTALCRKCHRFLHNK